MSRAAKMQLSSLAFAGDRSPTIATPVSRRGGSGSKSGKSSQSPQSNPSDDDLADYREPVLDLPPLGIPPLAGGVPGGGGGANSGRVTVAASPMGGTKKLTLLERRKSKGGISMSVVSGLGLSMDTLHENARDMMEVPDEPPRAVMRGWSTTVREDSVPSRPQSGGTPTSPAAAAASGMVPPTPSAAAAAAVAATPSKRGPRSVGSALASSRTVVAAPAFPSTALKVVAYNIMADRLTTTDRYPHCPPAVLGEPYRLSLIRDELRDAAADIIVLTEISVAVFEGADSLGGFLHNTLRYNGNHAVITDKKGTPRCVARSCGGNGDRRCSTPASPSSSSNNNNNGARASIGELPALHRRPSVDEGGRSVTTVPSTATSKGGSGGGGTSAGAGEEAEASDDQSRRTEMDGVAIFYDAARLELLECKTLYFNPFAAADATLTDLERRKLQVDSHNVALVSVLRDRRRPANVYVTAAVHLVWQREESQLYQGHLLLLALERLKAKYAGGRVGGTMPPTPVKVGAASATAAAAAASSDTDSSAPASARRTVSVRCVIAGDFNAEMASGVVRYMTRGEVPPDATTMASWRTGDGAAAASATLVKMMDDAFGPLYTDAGPLPAPPRVDRRSTRAPAPQAKQQQQDEAERPDAEESAAAAAAGDDAPFSINSPLRSDSPAAPPAPRKKPKAPRPQQPVTPTTDNIAFTGRRATEGVSTPERAPPPPPLSTVTRMDSIDSLRVSEASFCSVQDGPARSDVSSPSALSGPGGAPGSTVSRRAAARRSRLSLVAKSDRSTSERFLDPNQSGDELTASYSLLSGAFGSGVPHALGTARSSDSDLLHETSDDMDGDARDSGGSSGSPRQSPSHRNTLPPDAAAPGGGVPPTPKPPTRYFRPRNSSPRFATKAARRSSGKGGKGATRPRNGSTGGAHRSARHGADPKLHGCAAAAAVNPVAADVAALAETPTDPQPPSALGDAPAASPTAVTAAAPVSAFSHPLRFTSAYEVYCRKHPQLVSAVNPSTNMEGKVLDHVLYEADEFDCLAVLRLGARTDLPTATVPSDHYMVGAALAPSA